MGNWRRRAPVAAKTALATAGAMGGTPGSLLLGVVLVSSGGQRPGLLRAAVRLATALALGGLGLLWSFGGRPALHDRVSGTRLVLEDEASTPWPGPGSVPAP